MHKFYVQMYAALKQLIHVTATLLLFCSCLAQAQDNVEAGNAVAADAGDNGSAAAAGSDPSAGKTSGPRQTQAQWMNNYMAGRPARGALWLGEGNEPFVALFKKAVEARQIGLLLLADRPAQLTRAGWRLQLYNNLPLHGWSVLMTLLPEQQTEPTPSSETGAQARIQAASRHLLDQGSRSYALFADRLAVEDAMQACIADAGNCSGLVLWRLQEKLLATLPLEKLQQSRVSVLDVLEGQPDAESRLAREHEFRAAGFDRDYQAMVFPAAESPATNSIATKRIRHWLDTTFTSE